MRLQPWWTPCGSFRRWFVGWLDSAPWRFWTPSRDRCYMGGPVQDSVWCHRPAVYDDRLVSELWCRHHARNIRTPPSQVSADTPEDGA